MKEQLDMTALAESMRSLSESVGLGMAAVAVIGLALLIVGGASGMGAMLGVLCPRIVGAAARRLERRPAWCFLVGLINLVVVVLLLSAGEGPGPLLKLIGFLTLLYSLGLGAVATATVASLVERAVPLQPASVLSPSLRWPGLVGGCVFGAAALLPLAGQAVAIALIVAAGGAAIQSLVTRGPRRDTVEKAGSPDGVERAASVPA